MKAVIDIGSNTVLLLVARRDSDGHLHIERDEATITRLSRGVGQSGRLHADAIGQTLGALQRYKASLEGRDIEIEAVATEGVRSADNASSFLEPASEVLGVPVRIISGDEEARLSYRSVALEYPEPRPLRVIDIGGGSTEIVAGQGPEVTNAVSHRIGSVRLTEELIQEDPPGPAELQAIERRAVEAFATQPLDPLPELHGLAGTVTTVAALLLGLGEYERDTVDDSRFALQQVVSLRDELAAEPLSRRAKRPCLPAGRADVIVAGVTILLAAMRHCGAETLVVRDRGLRYALV